VVGGNDFDTHSGDSSAGGTVHNEEDIEFACEEDAAGHRLRAYSKNYRPKIRLID